MQETMDHFAAACTDFGLTINTKKTEVLHQPAPGQLYIEPQITTGGELLTTCEKFVYLGSTLSHSVHINQEVSCRISKASAAFGRLQSSVWDHHRISLSTKLQVYQAIVITSLLYGCEMWTVYSRHAKQLNRFHMCCLRKVMHVTWQEKIPDTGILGRANLPSIFAMLKRSQLRWSGHVHHMADDRLPKCLLYGELCVGCRSQGGQRKRYKDALKANLKCCNICPETWESVAANRSHWHAAITIAIKHFEQQRILEMQAKRHQRKSRT
ncbi:uncharacterized protein LOC132891976 [Neoarius graeffei]|uniref:uncharacterized protein LOC132891976 n=1 Tax=Neoarius graeffei TaxID=443677 RepID=UPI00298BE424|nr:uncharacterized protein LOC132891976 [Neoarius graeffei]